MMRFSLLLAAFAILPFPGPVRAVAASPERPVALTVDTGHVLREGADKFVGINLNYLRDADANRAQARPLQSALGEMGVRWLRYPSGEKSDFYLWSQPPYLKPEPTSLGWYASVPGARLDFDQYIATARAVGAEPYIVAGYDTFKRTGRTREQWIQNAVGWVRYSNIVRKYGVRYWEIGNENWNNGTATPTEMAQIVGEFSRAMKAVDPTIKIGSSGNSNGWWSKFLPVAAPSIDFLSLSHYNTWGWKSYGYIIQHPETDLAQDAREAAEAIDKYAPQADRARLKVIVAETNSKDYSEGGWRGDNTLGHAIITFDTLGRLMEQPRIASAMIWTTRWIKDEEAARTQWYALGPRNEILPTGRAGMLWSFAHKYLCAIESVGGNSAQLSCYSSCSQDRGALTIWIINRGLEPVNISSLAIRSQVLYRNSTLRRLSGTGPDDENATWKPEAAPVVKANALSGLACPGVSVSVIELQK